MFCFFVCLVIARYITNEKKIQRNFWELRESLKVNSFDWRAGAVLPFNRRPTGAVFKAS